MYKRQITGHAVYWDRVSHIKGVGPEMFTRGSLKLPDSGCSLYFQHDKKNLLANSKAGTLKLWEDDLGLAYEATLPKSATRVIESVQRKDCQGVSVGFVCEDEDRSFGQRKIKKAQLFELSLVDKPSHATSIKLRSRQDRPKKWTDLILEYPHA